MAYGLTVVTPPVEEPVTLAEAKLYARIDLGDDDALVTGLIAAGRQRCERVSGRALVTQTWKLTLDQFPGSAQGDPLEGPGFFAWGAGQGPIRLPRAPAQSVVSVQYTDGAGNLQTLPATQYYVDVTAEPARIFPAYGTLWPVTLWRAGAVAVTFTAGYGPASAVPDEIKARVKAYVAYVYREREDADEDFLERLFSNFSYGG